MEGLIMLAKAMLIIAIIVAVATMTYVTLDAATADARVWLFTGVLLLSGALKIALLLRFRP